MYNSNMEKKQVIKINEENYKYRIHSNRSDVTYSYLWMVVVRGIKYSMHL